MIIKNNSITVVKSDYDVLYININDKMFDMDKKITVYNFFGIKIFDDFVLRKRSQLLHSLHTYGGIYGFVSAHPLTVECGFPHPRGLLGRITSLKWQNASQREYFKLKPSPASPSYHLG